MKTRKMLIDFVSTVLKFMIVLCDFPKKNIREETSRKNILKKFKSNELWTEDDLKIDIKAEKEKNYDLSIIIPIYNVENYLKKCLESIFNQKTKYSYEVICINDGSTDNSLNILLSFKKFENLKIINQENQGLSCARNKGINNAVGKYITFIDSDDYISNNYIEILLDKAFNSNADMVKVGYNEFNNLTNKITKVIKYENKTITNNENINYLYQIKGHAWGSVIKRKIMCNIRFPRGYWYEDMITKILIIPKCQKIEILENTPYYYRINNNGLSRNVQKKKNYKCLEQYFLLEKLLEKYDQLIQNKNYEYIYNIILHELGTVLWLRTRYIDKKTIKDIFYLACILQEKYKIELTNKNFYQKYVIKSFEKRNLFLWKLISIYSMIKIKF